MLWYLTIALICVLTFFTVSQMILCAMYGRFLSKSVSGSPYAAAPVTGNAKPDFKPSVAVILCTRGDDPHLENCLIQLTRQDFENYSIHCVVDHAKDPSVKTISRVIDLESGSPINLHVVDHHDPNRSLKCNSLTTVIDEIGDRHDIVALIDADVVPDQNWLNDLVRPLDDELVGATTGNRWFIPPDNRSGTQCRFIWNAAAIVQMYSYGIAWGGSLAIKLDALRKSGLLDHWRRSLFEDTQIAGALRTCGLRLQTVGELLLINSESSTRGVVHRWIQRQLLDTRLYHRCWPLVASHGIATFIAPVVLFIIAAACLTNGQIGIAAAGAISVAAFSGFNFLAIVLVDYCARKTIGIRNNSVSTSSFSRYMNWLWVIPIARMMHISAIFHVMFAKKTSWRGIDYLIRSPDSVELVEYRPMHEIKPGETTNDSI